MHRFLVLFTVCLIAPAALARTRVVLLHFSDYHSHAVPFYSEGRRDQGGIVRAIGYLERERRKGAIVLDGGDMINKGSPAWSDKYGCTEWPWLNGIVDAMAFGNHDPDYGPEDFAACRKSVHFPILSANTKGFEPTAVLKSQGIRIGVFALAGDDFRILTKGFEYTDRIAAAREVVRDLRSRADVVVMIGHESTGEDYALAREVPGIDVIFGTHSHLKRELTKIDGTETWFISPYQYLTYVSRVDLTFDERNRLSQVTGRLVTMDAKVPGDAAVATMVSRMQQRLEADPRYAPLFEPIGRLREPLGIEGLGALTVRLMKEATGADVALSTVSSFRQALAPGRVTVEELRAAMPYDNEIVVATMTGRQLQELIALSEANAGTDNGTFHTDLAVDPARSYRVATTDYLARVSVYSRFFGEVGKSGKRVRENVERWIVEQSPKG